MGAAPVASLLFAGCAVADVVALGDGLRKEWIQGLKVSAIFAKGDLDALFIELDGMRAEAQAGEGGAPTSSERCAAEGVRVVRLLMGIMKEGNMVGLPEKDWLFIMGSEEDLAWLLEALGDKAKLLDDTLEK